MLVDPLVLKKKLNRMATEQGAFAVLSSLLLYVTELAAGDPQLSNKRTKWAEGKENKVSYNQPCPDPNRGQHPTRFQLLRSRFLNNNREPYTKKRREVGKLVIKEKLWVNRAGNKLDRSRDRKGDGKAAEEDADTVLRERARRSCTSGKNTVKNILKKFLAAEEKKEENSPSWKKKGPNSSLPKIVNRSSVLSKLKEKFEQSALCSAAEVKASLLSKGEKKTKNFPSRKTIRKPEVRVLRVAAMTAMGISTPASQYLVCSTVPVPKLSIATKINRPWSWSKNNAAKQPFSHETALKGSGESIREPGEDKTPANAAQDREDKEELLVTPMAMYDVKDHAEAKRDSTEQGHKFTPNLDSSSATQRNKYLADCIPPLSEHTVDCDRNNIPAGPDTSSLLGTNNAAQHVKEDNPPSNSPYSSTAEGSHEQSSQDTKTGEIPEITMYVYSSEEADTELTEPENSLLFAGQKCFPEQKALENILPRHSPGVQTCCEVEPPVEDGQITLLTPASGKRPPIVQKEAPDLRGRCSQKAKQEVKHHSEYKISSTSIKNDNDVPTKKDEENKTPNSQMQNESKTEQPQPPQTFSPQNDFPNSNADISNPGANQTKSTLSSKEGQEQKPGAAEKEHISSHLEKTQSPLSGDFVKHRYDVVEDFEKDKLSSSNEMMNHTNNRALHRSTITDLETHHKPSHSFIEHEEATADEMPCLDSEAWQSPSPTPLPTSVSGTAEERIHHSLGNPPDLPPIDLERQGDGGMGDEPASHGCEKHSPPSSHKLPTHGNDTTVENKTACDFKNQVLSPNHATDNENSTAEETNACQRSENCLSLSTKKPGKHENKTTLAREPLLPLEKNQTPPSDDTTKQGSDVPEDNLFPLSTELISNQKNPVKGRNKVSKNTKDKLLSSDDDMKHESDRMETGEREERNVLHKSEEQVFTPRDAVHHDNNSSNENAQKPQTPQLPSSEHDINTQGQKNTDQNLKHLTPSRDFVEHKDDMTVDENICCNNGKHHLSSLNEPMKYANDITGETNIKSNFNNYSMPPRNTSRQDNKTTDEENTSQNVKNEPVQHKKNCEGERNTSCEPKKQTPLPNQLMKQDKKLSPLKAQKQVSPDDKAKPENKLAEKKTKHTSEKLQSPSDKVLKPQERSPSGEKKKKTSTSEDTRVPETKAVKKNSEHKSDGNHHLPPSIKQSKPEKNTPAGEKQQTVPASFTKPNASDAKDKSKDPGPGMGQSPSSKSLVKSQEKNTTKNKQLPPPPAEKTTHKTESPEKKSGSQKREKYQLHSSAQSEKHSSQGSEKEGPVGGFKSYQAPLPGDGVNCKSNTPPKETSLSNTEQASKSSSLHVASKDEESPAGNRKNHPGLKKYQVLSSKNLVRQEKDVAERERSWQAAGKTREKKAETEDCSKAAAFSKYTVESYSESLLDSSFKPLIIRVTDTFKHHS